MTYHNITGGSHPFYVFKGNPIEKVNKLIDGNSVVNYDIMPTPVSIAKAFNYLSRGPNYVKKEIGGLYLLRWKNVICVYLQFC